MATARGTRGAKAGGAKAGGANPGGAKESEEGTQERRSRRNGDASREKIVDAAAAIASERGYDGTSIARVSERSGLPASSIYWHFADKDALIGAVIARSFERWLAGAALARTSAPDAPLFDRLVDDARRVGQALDAAPDFLRLGLMLALERRPEEPSARAMFLRVRAETRRRSERTLARLFPDLPRRDVEDLAAFAMAIADGLFVAREIGGARGALMHRYELQAVALIAVAERLRRDRTQR